MELEIINKLYLELSQVATAETKRERDLKRVIGMLDSMLQCGEQHSALSIKSMRDVMDK